MKKSRCPDCDALRPLSEFYISSRGIPSSYCKKHVTIRTSAWRRKNSVRYHMWRREYDRAHKERIDEYHRRWRSKPENKAKRVAWTMRYFRQRKMLDGKAAAAEARERQTMTRSKRTAKDLCEVNLFNPERVAVVRGRMLSKAQVEDMAAVFQCLGHATRVKILHALFSGEMCVCDLTQVLGLSISAVSHQLRILRTLQLVKYYRDGKMAYYSIDDEHVRSLFALGLDHVKHR